MTRSQDSPPRMGLVIVAMTIGNAIILISQTAVPLALPSMMHDLGVGSQTVQWALTASLLPLAGLMVLGGRLGDLFALRRTFIVGAGIFAAASAAAGLAPTFEVLLACRVAQGIGGALLLPNSVAIVAAAARGQNAGRALGLLGGAAAVAGALGPVIGGALAGTFGWRAVMLVNVPLALLSIAVTLAVVPAGAGATSGGRVDLVGAALLCITLVGIVFGVTQSQSWGWSSAPVIISLIAAAVSGLLFVLVERRVRSPLMDFRLLARHKNYAGATISQSLGGMVEMGLGVLFPLVLILNLGLTPTVAGIALLVTTLPMVIVAPLVGRWYDRVGGRVPLVVGFSLLALSGVALAGVVVELSMLVLIPGFLLYGVGLAIVLTTNDPVSLDSVPEEHHGQASGVSATAEQFGGALGIALFYLVFHSVYVAQLHGRIDDSSLANLSDAEYARMRDEIVAAEATGLKPSHFDAALQEYLPIAFQSSATGYAAAFAGVVVVSVIGIISSAFLVSKVTGASPDTSSAQEVFASGVIAGSAGNLTDLTKDRGMPGDVAGPRASTPDDAEWGRSSKPTGPSSP